ncbi:MAG: signal peptide peptidase SppA [Verrucomicrobiota bacterium]|jgi:protease-4
MKNKSLGCLLAFLTFALLVSVVFNLLQLAALMGLGDPETALGMVQPREKFGETLEQPAARDSKDKVVRIDIEGVISSAVSGGMLSSSGMDIGAIKRSLEQALEDSHVKAIVLRVNSPGGEVTASDTLYHAVQEAAKRKPVVVYMDSMAASGGYYLSCGATKIVANETTLTGSIGVIIQTLNYRMTMDKVGLQSVTFTSGAFKDSLNGARDMRPEEKAYVQDLVSQMYDKFLGIVSDARKLSKETLKEGIADGRVFTGKQALEKKLVDQLGYVEDAYALGRQLGGAPDAMVVRYVRARSLADFLGVFAESAASHGSLKIDVSDRLLPRLEPGKAYLLPAHMVP